VGFQPTIPMFERAKTFHVLDRAATAIGGGSRWEDIIKMDLMEIERVIVDHINSAWDGGRGEVHLKRLMNLKNVLNSLTF
jgi:hypothetical protein